MISDKANLSALATSTDRTKAPRCSDRIARLYRSKERLLDAVVSAKKEVHDRRAVIHALVAEHLGDASAMGLRCERYLRDAAYRWLLPSRSPATWRTYLSGLWKWIQATDKRSLSAQVDTVPSEVMDFLLALEEAGASQRTVALRRDTLRAWFGWLLDRDLIARTPVRRETTKAFRVDHERVVKGSGVREALTQAEAQRVVIWALTIARPVVGFSVMIELCAALRSAEIAALEARHLVEHEADADGTEGDTSIWQLTVPGKGNKTRTVVCEPVLIAAFHRYWRHARRQGHRGPLLLRPGGGHYGSRTIQAWAKAAARHIGRDEAISSHAFRATCSTILRERGADESQVQALLGHSDPRLTRRCYVRRPKALTTTTGLTIPTASTEVQPPATAES